jgi:hypothetical protein
MKTVQRLLVLFVLGMPLFSGCPDALAGSPFYLTAERSFSSAERPQIRLDYTETIKPMVVRVLRPKNLEQFLEGQFQVSRSYEEPVSELNLGHYFVKGLNKTEPPLRVFRTMLDSDFRQAFKDTPLHDSIVRTYEGPIATPPEQVIHNAPVGFETVREYYLELQFGGKSVTDPGWWFGDAYWREESYKIRQLNLDPLPDGIYLVQAVQGITEAQCILQVSSLSVQVKQSSEQFVAHVIDRDSNPVAGAVVSYRDSRGKWVNLDKRTDQSGETAFLNPDGVLDGKLVVRIQTDEGKKALVDTDFLPVKATADSVFIVTDRPIFKPGETFSFKGIVREQVNGQLRAPDSVDKEARVRLTRADGTPTDVEAKVPVTDFGSFSGTLGLDELQPPGLYRLVAEIGGKPYGGEFRVRDYIKPVFYLEMIDRSRTVTQGRRFFLKFRARRYSGGIPKELKYEVFLYRKKFEVPQWVTEAGSGLLAGNDYFGQIRSVSSLSEPRRVFSSVEARLSNNEDYGRMNTWESAPKVDESGDASFEFDIPVLDNAGEIKKNTWKAFKKRKKAQREQAASGAPVKDRDEWIYTLVVRALDQAGSQAVLSENIYVTLSDAQPSVRFSETTAGMGDKGQSISIRSTYPDGKPAPKCGGVVNLGIQQSADDFHVFATLPFSTDDQGMSKIPLPELKVKGRMSAVAILETIDGKSMRHSSRSEPAVMIVGGAEGETVFESRELELHAATTILSPGEKVRMLALLPSGWGKAESGTVWETIAGDKIFRTKPVSFKGRSRWFEVEARPEYGTGFYETITVPMGGGKFREQTLGFRIIPRDKVLKVDIFPEREETEALKPFKIDFQVKDSDGRPAARTELAVTVVDRAVYAVQSEIRPPIFDFFYPLRKLNLATFYSDELQGYGYGDILKKPNFRLGALKSQSKPTKKGMRDTAGWFPHVVTDAEGRTSVTVDMPANITEWLVTAIAADKEGRVGESIGKFRSVSDVSVEVLSPQFLREGEKASILVKAINYLAQSISLASRIEVSGALTASEQELSRSFSIDGKGETVQPLTIEAKGEGGSTVRVALEGEKNLRIGGAEEFDISVKAAAMNQLFAAVQKQDRLDTELPEAGRARELKILISPGLLGAALNASASLVSYPYGCTEQLVHSTVPNLVLMELVHKAGITNDQLGPLREVLVRAENNAAAGIKKLRQNQKSDGGFGLWPSDSEASIPVTLTALYGLKLAEKLKIEGAAQAYSQGTSWLSKQPRKEDSGGSALIGYDLSRFAELGSYHNPWEQQVEFVQSVANKDNPGVHDLIYALRIFAGYKDNEWDRFVVRFKDTDVKEKLTEKLIKVLDRLGPDDFAQIAQKNLGTFEELGFGFGAPYLVSAGMGVLDQLGSLSPELETKLKKVIIFYFKKGKWGSTFDTAEVILNSMGSLEREAAGFVREREANNRSIAVLKRNGETLGNLTPIPLGYVGIFKQPGELPDISSVTVQGIKPDETASATISADIPFRAVRSSSHGVTVERSFYRITPQGNEVLNLSRPLQKGDLVVSEVRVRRNQERDIHSMPSHFLVVEDGIPSLGVAISEDETYLADAGIQKVDDTYWGAIKETQRHPDKTVRIAKVLPGGEIKVYQVWRIGFSGKASIPPARAFDMYDEELWGNTSALEIETE